MVECVDNVQLSVLNLQHYWLLKVNINQTNDIQHCSFHYFLKAVLKHDMYGVNWYVFTIK